MTGSYDHSLCVYRYLCVHVLISGLYSVVCLCVCPLLSVCMSRTCSDEVNCEYELVEKIEVNGAVECLAFAKVSAVCEAERMLFKFLHAHTFRILMNLCSG